MAWLQGTILWRADWVLSVLQHEHGTSCVQLPVSWCTQWKGTPQDCVDHIRKKHYVNDSVKAANHGRWFPPWTVMREAWHTALKTKVSGISTNVTLFSTNGSQLVHHSRVFGQCAAHASLCGTFISDLWYFTIRACADAKWAAKRNRT